MNQSDQDNLRKILASSQGQRLLKLLSRDGGSAINQAGQAVKQGDGAKAQEIMEPLMKDPEVQKLLQALNQSLHHG